MDAGSWPRRAFGAWLRRVHAFLAEAGKLLVVVAVVIVVVVVAVVIVAVWLMVSVRTGAH